MAKTFEQQLYELLKNHKIDGKIKKQKSLFLISLMSNKDVLYRGRSAVSWAYEFCENDIAEALIEKGGREVSLSFEEFEDLNDALIKAIQKDNLDKVKGLVEKGADVDCCGPEGCTLELAIKKKRKKVVELLIEEGADVNRANFENWTPLMEACAQSNLEMVEILLDKGASVNAVDDDNYSSLMLASRGNDIKIVEKLIKKGASVNHKANNKNTALMLASIADNDDVATLLIDNGAKLDEKNDEGLTALMLAAPYGNYDTVEVLCKRGANPFIKDINGYTAYTWAKKARMKNTANLIKEYENEYLERKNMQKTQKNICREI